jgi:asparagine synthase (glutamine-hydrolysing)
MPAYVDQLLSAESLQKTGYFDPQAVALWRQKLPRIGRLGYKRSGVEMGLVTVLATQLWHQQFIDSSLADLPSAPG